MPTTTSNYSLLKPLVNNATDQDLWGGYLNDDMDDIDGLLRAGITIATQASQTTGFVADVSISVKKLYPCDATGGAFAATLPTAATAGNGGTVFFKKTDASANAVTVTRASSDTIDGANTFAVSGENDYVGIVSDGVSRWNIISKSELVTAGYGLTETSGVISLNAVNSYQNLPSDPTSTTSTSGVMMGLQGALTPTGSGIVLITISGDIENNSGGAGARTQVRYGTGAAPANGAAATGTAISGAVRNFNPNSSGGMQTPFSIQAIVTGLTLSTPIWADASLAAITSGVATMKNVSISMIELK